MYKALFTDVDGTLITSQNSLPSKETKEAISKLKKYKNTHVSIVTARPYRKIKKICRDLGLNGLSVVSGGARIVNVKTGVFHRELTLHHKKILKISNLLQNFNKNIHFWIQDDGIDYLLNNSYKPYKPLVVVAHNLTYEYAARILDKSSSLRGVFCTKVPSYKKGFVDVNFTHEKATKINGVKIIANSLGISKKEIAGAGDGHNDLHFINSCGLKIAMGNAINEVKTIADYIAPNVEEDGLAEAINKYLL